MTQSPVSDQSTLYYVVFRACDRVNAVNGAGRPGGIHKTQLVMACFESLEIALQKVPHRIVVLGDKLSDELSSFFRNRGVELILGSYGNDESIRQALALGLKAPPNSWVYFCEDDYLHTENAFEVIDELVRNRSNCLANSPLNPRTWFEVSNARHVVIFPADYPDRYLARQRQRSMLYAAPSWHWRQVQNITFTFMASIETIEKYAGAIKSSATRARDGRLSRIMFKGLLPRSSALGLSPVPGVAAHMHVGTMSPTVDWERRLKSQLESLTGSSVSTS